MDSAVSKPGECDPDRQQDRGKDKEKLGSRRQPGESLSCRHDFEPKAKTLLAELSQKIEEIVGHRFAERIVVDRAKRAPEVALALAASTALGSL